jgi:hypothetical protein
MLHMHNPFVTSLRCQFRDNLDSPKIIKQYFVRRSKALNISKNCRFSKGDSKPYHSKSISTLAYSQGYKIQSSLGIESHCQVSTGPEKQ